MRKPGIRACRDTLRRTSALQTPWRIRRYCLVAVARFVNTGSIKPPCQNAMPLSQNDTPGQEKLSNFRHWAIFNAHDFCMCDCMNAHEQTLTGGYKMRRPSSKIFNTALYLHRVLNCHTFTAREIHDAMPAARKYYHSLIPAHVLAERDRLLVEYHAVDSWDQTYTYRVHGMPEGNYDDLVELNTKLRRLFRGYIVIDEPYYSTNLVADQVCNTYKRGYFLRDDSTRPILYRINPTYLGGN